MLLTALLIFWEKNKFIRSNSELKNKVFRRSIFAVNMILKKEKNLPKNIRRIRLISALSQKF